ncbi:MAG: sodium:alanine symporter family protein [Ruminococcaceae bacterium]|nr:sodium:alanine symporter family protein [Oscillospiraceae bacterium]
MEGIIHALGEFVWGWPLLLLFLGVGLWYTVRLRGIQFRYLFTAFRYVFSSGQDSGISPYAALCTALAATIGTGNIVGVATALALGGPGALFWMLFAAFFGMATQYAECFLAAKYRIAKGFGGPFAYIEKALGKKKLAKLYAVFGAGAGILGVGTVTQVNSITTAVDSFFPSAQGLLGQSWTVVITGMIVTILSALVLLGGAKRISKVCETLVPFMSAIYIICCLVLLICTRKAIPSAVSLILRSAFSPKAALGAASGISFKMAVRMGVSRGVFTNEAGLGTSAIAAASTNVTDPVRQGLVSMTGTFIDTIVICTMTGLCLITTGAWCMPLEGVALTDFAWQTGLPWAHRASSFLLMLCLVFFAFATIIGWNFYAESCLRYLTHRYGRLYRFFYLCAIALAPYYTVRLAWEAADVMNALLAVPNLIALLCLQKSVVRDTRRTLHRKQKIM